MSKRKENDSVTPPQLIRISRRRLYTSPNDMSNAVPTPTSIMATSSQSITSCTPTVTGPAAQPYTPHIQQQSQSIVTDQTFVTGHISPSIIPSVSTVTPSMIGLSGFQLAGEDGQTFDFTQLLLSTMTSPAFLNPFIVAMGPFINNAIQSATKPLLDEIKSQKAVIDKQDAAINHLTQKNTHLSNRVLTLECELEELEQYGWRNSLCFHNVTIPSSTNTYDIIVKICKEKLDVEITKEDMNRSRPVGRPNRSGKAQVICRFRNWKIKNSIYTMKKKLKGDTDRIFVTEDLTRYRQLIISQLSDAKRDKQVTSFWTNDGRIFVKLSEGGPKYMIRCLEDLPKILNEERPEEQAMA